MEHNLALWTKGQSGNPRGRPPSGRSLADALRTRLNADVVTSEGKQVTVGDAIAAKLVAMALGGDIAAIKLVFERTEGRAPLMADSVIDDPQTDAATMTPDQLMLLMDRQTVPGVEKPSDGD